MLFEIEKNGHQVYPDVPHPHFIAHDANLIGDVSIASEVSIFYGAVLRGDLEAVKVGSRTNIQEHCLLHTTSGRSPCIIENNVTIGHRAIVHGAYIYSHCLIGMGAIILDDSVISPYSLVGAGSLVTEGKKFPPKSLILGSPAKAVRTLEDKEIDQIKKAADSYVKTGRKMATAVAK